MAISPLQTRRGRRLGAVVAACAMIGVAGCTGHPSEGAARGAATGMAGALVMGSPAVVAVPAGAATGATANSFWQAWQTRRTQCAQLARCVY
jgi:hypothetical protein